MVRDKQGVLADGIALDARPDADDPCRGTEEPSRPWRPAEQPPGDDLDRRADQEQEDDRAEPKRAPKA
jgi:hypothetical protein